jgi:hypothetical protein
MASEQLGNRAMVADMTRSFKPKVGSLEGKLAFEKAMEESARAAAAGLVVESRRRQEAAATAAANRKKMDESSKVVDETRKEIGALWGGKRRRMTAKRFCGCVKKVKSAKKNRTEGSSIAICTSSLLWPHGKTLHSVSCRSRKKSLKTQKRTTRKK